MSYAASYLVDFASIKLDETSTSVWFQAMPIGKYQHPIHGEIDINPERVKHFADNVKQNVRGQDLNIDYDHQEGIAAGWVRDADARNDGLWLNVEFTKAAHQKLKDKEYRYFSPEFNDEWENPATKVMHKDVLFGGGITNRPFLKGILPINLSEAFADASEIKSNEGGTVMALTGKALALATKLGLGADATEDQLYGELDTFDFVTEEIPTGGAPAQLSELPQDLIKLSESNPAIKQLVDTVNAQGQQLAEASNALKLSEVTGTLFKLNEKAKEKGFAIPPATQEELMKSLMASTSKQLSETIIKGYEAILDGQLVALGERYSGGGPGGAPRGDEQFPATTKFLSEVKVLTDAKIGYADAVNEVAKRDPQLYAAYTVEATSGTE